MKLLMKKIGVISLSILFTFGMSTLILAHGGGGGHGGGGHGGGGHGGGEHHMGGEGEHHFDNHEHPGNHHENHHDYHHNYHPNYHPNGNGFRGGAVIDEQGGGTTVIPVNDGYNNDNYDGYDDPMDANPQTQGGQIFDMYNQNNR